MLEDADSARVHFTLLTQKGNTSLERGASVIRQSLAQVGVRVDVVGLEVGALIQYVTRQLRRRVLPAADDRYGSRAEPRLLVHLRQRTHLDPSQRTPSTPWESEIDGLMDQMSTTLDAGRRRALFAGVQRSALWRVKCRYCASPSHACRLR